MTLTADTSIDVEALADQATRKDGCGRPDSPLWMAEWCYYQMVMDTGLFRGPLERSELSGRLVHDKRLRHIDALVTAFAEKLAARLHPGAWAARTPQGGRKAASYKCGDCGDPVSRRKNMKADPDGAIRCGRCQHYLARYGMRRPGAVNNTRVRAGA